MAVLGRNSWVCLRSLLSLPRRSGAQRGSAVSQEEKVGRGDFRDALAQVLVSFELTFSLSEKVRLFLTDVLGGKEPGQFELSRIHGLLEEYLAELAELMLKLARVLGSMAVQEGSEEFIGKMERYFPMDDPDRDRVLVASLAGYQCQESHDLLIEYVNACAEPDLLAISMDALEEYHAEDVPSGVEKLCFDEHQSVLRGKALRLVAQWGHAEGIINRLLETDSLSARADGIKTLAEYRIMGCYPNLLKLLRSGIQDSLLIAVLEGLRAFDDSATGRGVKPFLIPPHTLSIRKAALETMHRAGGPDRLELILKTFEQNTHQNMGDLLEYFLELILEGNFDEIQQGLILHRDFWLRMLPEVEGNIKVKLITMIERLEIEDEIMARTWADGLDKLLAQFRGKTVRDEERRLSAIAERLKKQVALWHESTMRIKVMQNIMDGLDSRNQYQQVQSMRKLAQDYRPAMVQEQPASFRKLVARVQEYLEDPNTPPEVMLQTISVAGSLRHPKLHRLMEKLLDAPSVSIRNAAAAALAHPVDPTFVKPIESVFIMDDSRYITKQLSKVLAEAGLDVDYENDVMEGMAQLEEKSYDLLILDLIMPGMTGATFLKKGPQRRDCPGSRAGDHLPSEPGRAATNPQNRRQRAVAQTVPHGRYAQANQEPWQ